LYEKGWSDDCLSGDPPDAHNSTTYLGIESAARSRGEDEKIRINPAAPSGLPVIALTVGTTSRGFRWESFDVSPLFGILLPSLLRTLEEGFEFRCVLFVAQVCIHLRGRVELVLMLLLVETHLGGRIECLIPLENPIQERLW
jgi:hypothetical protein